MKVDSDRIIELRSERSWSQEELAIASGLNLRTIQRIEKEGVISLQSKKALAATFAADISVLDYIEPVVTQQLEYRTIVIKNDVNWLSSWGKKPELATGPFKVDDVLNDYAKQGWRVHTYHHGNNVHGGVGQIMVLLERTIEKVKTKNT
mgnify:CR=1 FL=1